MNNLTTEYYIDIINNEEIYDDEEILEVFCEILGEEFSDEIENFLNGDCWDRVWGNCTEEMKKISKRFPELVFEIYGDWNAWAEYFKNGKSQFCARILPVYDESKLS